MKLISILILSIFTIIPFYADSQYLTEDKEIEKDRIDIKSILTQLAESTESDETVIEGEYGLVAGDETLLKQAFDNLIRNAVEAMEQSTGRIIKINGEIKGDIQMIRIGDSGHGIKEEDMSKVFIPFFSTKRPTA